MLVPENLSNDEIEDRIDAEIERSKLWGAKGTVVLDVEAFIETHLDVALDTYAPLDDDLLGMVEFEDGRRTKVSLNCELTALWEDGEGEFARMVGRARWRMTAAHEGAHVILHEELYRTSQPQEDGVKVLRAHRCFKHNHTSFFGNEIPKPARQQVPRNIQKIERQACRAGAALLMPRFAFQPYATEAMKRAERHKSWTPEDQFKGAIRAIAEEFGVSRETAKIRCAELGLIESGKWRSPKAV